MALKGLDIFKLTPKTNCKDCGIPTCMAFSMKVAQGAISIDKCPHMSPEALTKLGEATEPPMKTISFGDFSIGGETVLFRHDKTFVNKPLFAANLTADSFDKISEIKKIDYDRIGERMYMEALNLVYDGNLDAYIELVKKSAAEGRALILDCADATAAKAALDICKDSKPLLNGANAENFEQMSALAMDAGASLGVSCKTLDELYDTVKALEALGNKNLVLNVSIADIKDAFAQAVQIRRGAIKDSERSFGYPSIVNLAKLAPGDANMQTALASVFIMKYGSIIIMDDMEYSKALPLFGLRQNIYTDPQKPMTVEPSIYPINGADETSICLTTVDFALTYFIISGEIESSGVPANLLISDAGGYSVLTAWAAGKLSASSLQKFFKEFEIENKLKSRTLCIPGKVAVLKGEIEEALPGWNIVVAPNEAVGLVKFLKEMGE